MNVYFLTGASGAVGSAIVPLLLDRPDTEVRLLLRAESDAALAGRIETLLEYWGWSGDVDKRRRIVPLRGDAARPNFALDAEAYARLVSETTHVIHCAASVRMNDPLDQARSSAVGSARAILEFAGELSEAGRLVKVEFVSTVGVAGKRPGALPESWITEPREFHNTYEQSKAEAEQLVRGAIEAQGLPITVHRPSMVIGDSRSGRIIHFQIFYFICEFLSGRKTMGLYPDFGAIQLDIIPVDWVADAIVSASNDTTSIGQIFHLCSGPSDSPNLTKLKGTVRKAFSAHRLPVPPDRTIPRSLFACLPRIASMLAPADKRKALSTLPIYLDYLADTQGFDNTRYKASLHSRGLELPNTATYLDRILDRYLESKYG